MNRMFLVENGKYVVIRNNIAEIYFQSIEDFNKYCGDLVDIDLTGKNYIDYEPERNIYYDDKDSSISMVNYPNTLLESLIDNVELIQSRVQDPYYGVSIEEAYLLKRNEITQYRESLLAGGYTHTDGHTYDTDQKARERLLGIVTAINMGHVVPENFVWMTKDNIMVSHNNTSIVAMFLSLLEWEKNILEVSWFKKDVELVNIAQNAATVLDIKNYDITNGFS